MPRLLSSRERSAASPALLPPAVAAILGVAALGIHFAVIVPWRHDDAFIAYRYAENWAAGEGPVYNPGERVEGYTSFLWVALLALGHRLGADTVLLSQVLGFVFAAATVVLVAACRRWLRDLDPATAVLLLSCCGVFTTWPRSGMETSLVTLLTTGFALLHLALVSAAPPVAGRRAAMYGMLGAVLVMTRPDTVILVGLGWLDLIRRHRWREARGMALGFAVLYLPYFAWRWGYYGWLLPNTFYVKVGFGAAVVKRGLVYAGRFLIPALGLVVPIAAALAVRRGRAALARLALVGAFLLAHTAYVIAVGGDFTAAFRFFAPVVPLLAIVAARAQRALFSVRAAMVVTVASCTYGVMATRWVREITHYMRGEKVAEQGEEVGRWLARHAPPDAVLATNTAGSIPYYSGLRTIDMLGLNDVHIAHREQPGLGRHMAGHERHDGLYVLSRGPHYIHFGSSRGSIEPKYPGDHEIAQSPDFRRDYVLDVHRMVGRRFVYDLCIYRRRDVVER
jgi:hypothetical protein